MNTYQINPPKNNVPKRFVIRDEADRLLGVLVFDSEGVRLVGRVKLEVAPETNKGENKTF